MVKRGPAAAEASVTVIAIVATSVVVFLRSVSISSVIQKPCTTEIYLHFLIAHDGLSGNAPVQAPSAPVYANEPRLSNSTRTRASDQAQAFRYHSGSDGTDVPYVPK